MKKMSMGKQAEAQYEDFGCTEADLRAAIMPDLPPGASHASPLAALLPEITSLRQPYKSNLAALIARCPKVTTISFRDTDWRMSGFHRFPGDPEPEAAGATMARVVAAWPRLEHVDVDYFGGSLAPLRETLRSLHVSQQFSAEAGAAFMAMEGGWPALVKMETPGNYPAPPENHFPALTELKIGGNFSWDEATAQQAAKAFPAVTDLTINGFNTGAIDEGVLAFITALAPQLSTVFLHQMPVSKAAQDTLVSVLMNVKTLRLSDTKGAFAFSKVASTQLEHVTCPSFTAAASWSKKKETDAATKVLASLKTLKLSGKLDDERLKTIVGKCPALESLALSSTDGVTVEGLVAALQQTPKLREFTTNGNKALGDDAIAAVCRTCPSLEVFSLRTWSGGGKTWSNITNASLRAIASLSKVTSVSISHSPEVTTAGVKPLVEKHGGTIGNLDLMFCGTDDESMALIGQHCANGPLHSLSLRGTSSLTQETLSRALAVLPHLKTIDCWRAEASDFSAAPSLRSITV